MEIIAAPEVQPMPYGLLSVARAVTDDKAADQGFTYPAACGTGIGFTDPPCPPPDTPEAKAVTGELTWVESTDRFVMYALTQCNAIGRDPSVNGAVDRMNASESHVLEQRLATLATSIGSATDMSQALGLLQASWFAATAGVRPVIHINAALLQYAKNVERHGNRLELVNGAYVSAGTGYPTDAIYISGMPTIARGTMVTRDIHNPTDNIVTDFAERMYAMSPGCEGISSVGISLLAP